MTTDTKVADLPAKWRAKAKRIRGMTAGSDLVVDIMEESAEDLEGALARQEAVDDDIIAAAELRGYRRRQEEEAAQEPVAWYLPSEDGYDSCFRDHSTITSCTGNPWTGWIPLYTAPPAAQADHFPDATKKGAAQAVDLGQFRDCVIEAKESWLQCAENWKGRVRESQYREWVDDCDRLLKLIDQQAGGEG